MSDGTVTRRDSNQGVERSESSWFNIPPAPYCISKDRSDSESLIYDFPGGYVVPSNDYATAVCPAYQTRKKGVSRVPSNQH